MELELEINIFDVKTMINDRQDLSSKERLTLRSLLNTRTVEPEIMMHHGRLKNSINLRQIIAENISGPPLADVKLMICERQSLTDEERVILRALLNSGDVSTKDILSHRLLVKTSKLLDVIEERYTKPTSSAVMETAYTQRFSPTESRRKKKEKPKPTGPVKTFDFSQPSRPSTPMPGML